MANLVQKTHWPVSSEARKAYSVQSSKSKWSNACLLWWIQNLPRSFTSIHSKQLRIIFKTIRIRSWQSSQSKQKSTWRSSSQWRRVNLHTRSFDLTNGSKCTCASKNARFFVIFSTRAQWKPKRSWHRILTMASCTKPAVRTRTRRPVSTKKKSRKDEASTSTTNKTLTRCAKDFTKR